MASVSPGVAYNEFGQRIVLPSGTLIDVSTDYQGNPTGVTEILTGNSVGTVTLRIFYCLYFLHTTIRVVHNHKNYFLELVKTYKFGSE